MNWTRRELLGVGGLLAVGVLPGCTTGEPASWTRVALSLREPFAAEEPTSVPVTVDVELQDVDDPEIALRGLSVACYDGNGDRLGRRDLGDFARQSAPAARRTTEHVEGTWSSATAYGANWSLAPDVAVDAVPRWISVAVESVEIAPPAEAAPATTGTGATTGLLPVGRARASQPAPEFAATIRRLAAPVEAGEQVRPADYDAVDVDRYRADGRGVGVESPLLPEDSPEAGESPVDGGST